ITGVQCPVARAIAVRHLLWRHIRAVSIVQMGGVPTVVMRGEDVPNDVLPAIVADHRAGAVELMGDMVGGHHRMTLAWIARNVIDAPAFIERDPPDDRGMVSITGDRLAPFAEMAVDCRIGIGIRGADLAPEQEAEPVGPIQEPWILHLLVKPRAIEPKFEDQL